MKKTLLISGASLALIGILGVGGYLLFGGSSEPVPVAAVEQEEVERVPIVVLQRPNQDPLEIFGPNCYVDTRGNDTVVYNEATLSTDCITIRNGGNDLIDLSGRSVDQPALIAIRGSGSGRQTIRLGPANDYVEIQGQYNAFLEGTPGQNTILSLPEITTVDLKFRQSGQNVILDTPRGSITLSNQSQGSGLEGIVSNILLSGGRSLDRSQIKVQSVVGQGTSGNDNIRSTDDDDIIFPGQGNDVITLLGGKNRVHYTGGEDRIISSGQEGAFNTLYIESNREDVLIDSVNGNRDLKITTEKGSVTLVNQLFFDAGNIRVPVQEFVFIDGPVTDEQIRFLLEIEEQERQSGAVDDRTRLRQ